LKNLLSTKTRKKPVTMDRLLSKLTLRIYYKPSLIM
jgi:hypothetical protein